MRRWIVLFALLATLSPPALAESLQVIGAGSLTDAMSDLLRRFPPNADTIAPGKFGPSGLMRQQIQAGAPADIFASADMENARILAQGHPDRMVIHFTRNRLCAIARTAVGLTTDTMLDRMLDPKVRIATSTPGADPGGDYAFAVFARAEAEHQGARAALEAKALKLVGGGDKTPLLVPGKGAVEGVFLADRADIMLGYCSGAPDIARAVPGLSVVRLPASLTVGPAYGMALLNTRPVTLRFAAFVMSETGQGLLRDHGFDPTAATDAPPAKPGLMLTTAGVTHTLTPEQLASLPAIAQRVVFMTSPGSETTEWTGPKLWDLLVQAQLADPARPADAVHQILRVTGSDGYTAAFAVAELTPAFAGKPIQLALQANGKPLALPRLIVPGEARGGRSVRDVIRLDLE